MLRTGECHSSSRAGNRATPLLHIVANLSVCRKMPPLDSFEPFLWIPTILGAVCLPFAIRSHLRRRQQLASMALLECEVIGHSNSEPGMFYTEYRATLTNGAIEEFRGDVASSPKKFRVGDRVSAYYDPCGKPRFIVNEFLEKWFLTHVLYLASVCGLLSFPVCKLVWRLMGHH